MPLGMYKHFFTPEYIKMSFTIHMHIYIFSFILGKLLSHLGSLRLNEGLVESAEDLLTEARDAVETSGNLTAKATIMYNLGLLRSGSSTIVHFGVVEHLIFELHQITPTYLYINMFIFSAKIKSKIVSCLDCPRCNQDIPKFNKTKMLYQFI